MKAIVHVLNPQSGNFTICGNSPMDVQWVAYAAKRAATCHECRTALEHPVLCPRCNGQGFEAIAGHRVQCPICAGDGEVSPARRDEFIGEHGI